VTAYLLDTHVWAWAIKFDKLLPQRMANMLIRADAIHISSVSFYEITQKVRIGKWPEMEPIADGLSDVLSDQGGQLASMTGEIGQLAGLLDWGHRDPFDRMIAATSIVLHLPLVSADPIFDQLSSRSDWPGRVW
jgi:PIN domain nuclease of toxin-antitoxin system